MAKPIYDYEYEYQYESETYGDGDYDVVKIEYYLCGKCKEMLLDDDWEICPYCGEPIDWSDINE